MTKHVKSDLSNGILALTLVRPDKMNALSNAMYAFLADSLEEAEKSASVRAVLFQGAGDHLTAGNDLTDFAKATGDSTERPAFRFIRALATAKKPLIAAVQGNAVGIGTTMLLHCDLVFLAETARLSTPFVNLALVPEAASSHLLPDRIGYARAYAMFALGEPLDARSALETGLANAVVPVGELKERARKAAESLAKKPAASLASTKSLMRDRAGILAQIAKEGEIFSERLQSVEAKEAFSAFRERRSPDFLKIG